MRMGVDQAGRHELAGTVDHQRAGWDVDGRADRGNFRFSAYSGGGTPPLETRCYDSRSGLWRAAENEANCGAASLF